VLLGEIHHLASGVYLVDLTGAVGNLMPLCGVSSLFGPTSVGIAVVTVGFCSSGCPNSNGADDFGSGHRCSLTVALQQRNFNTFSLLLMIDSLPQSLHLYLFMMLVSLACADFVHYSVQSRLYTH